MLTQLPVLASDTSSAIRGQVVDSTGMALAGVTIQVTHLSTGKVKTITTTDGGAFKAKGLPVGGPYSVTVSGGTILNLII